MVENERMEVLGLHTRRKKKSVSYIFFMFNSLDIESPLS